MDEDTQKKYKLKPEDDERKSVNSNIARLEARGMIVRRVESSDEALDMSRSLLKQGRLRCVVTEMRRTKTNSGLALARELIEGIPDTGNSKKKFCVPADRICVFDIVDVRSKETKRLKFWKLGIQVMNDNNQLIEFVQSIPFWPDQIAKREQITKSEKELCAGRVIVLDNQDKDTEIKELVKTRSLVIWCVKNGRNKPENQPQFDMLKNGYDDVILVELNKLESFMREIPSTQILVAVVR